MNGCWSLKGRRFVNHVFGRRKDGKKLLSRTPSALSRAASRMGEEAANRSCEAIECLTNQDCA